MWKAEAGQKHDLKTLKRTSAEIENKGQRQKREREINGEKSDSSTCKMKSL